MQPQKSASIPVLREGLKQPWEAHGNRLKEEQIRFFPAYSLASGENHPLALLSNTFYWIHQFRDSTIRANPCIKRALECLRRSRVESWFCYAVGIPSPRPCWTVCREGGFLLGASLLQGTLYRLMLIALSPCLLHRLYMYLFWLFTWLNQNYIFAFLFPSGNYCFLKKGLYLFLVCILSF